MGSSKADLVSSQLSVVPFHASRLALCIHSGLSCQPGCSLLNTGLGGEDIKVSKIWRLILWKTWL